jgi:hypothetical protein
MGTIVCTVTGPLLFTGGLEIRVSEFRGAILKGVGLPMLLIRDWGLTPDVFV